MSKCHIVGNLMHWLNCFFLLISTLMVQNKCTCNLLNQKFYLQFLQLQNFIIFHQKLICRCIKMMSTCLSNSFDLMLTLNALIATKVVCFSRQLKCLRSLYGKQCGLRSDCFYRSSLFWVHAVCFHTLFVGNVWQLFVADDFSRRHFQIHFFLGALRVKSILILFLLLYQFVNYKHEVLVNSLVKFVQEKVWLGELTVLT